LKPKSKKTKKLPLGSKDTTNLFGKDFSFEEEDDSDPEKKSPKTDLLESELDINDLFGDEDLETEKSLPQPKVFEDQYFDDLFGDEDLEKEKTKPKKEKTAALETDINDLFGDLEMAEIEIDTLFNEEDKESQDMNEFDDLFASLEESLEINNISDLFAGDGAENQEQRADLFAGDGAENQEEIIDFYESLEEIEQLINTTETREELNFENLAAIIAAPVLETNFNIEEKTTQIEAEDEDFADLEAMLQQSAPSMGGTAINNPTANKSVFEQTMKVPVKQLDNLNNLMGELVVNRNSLEQDQERMRQFLENLLNHVGNLSDVGARMQDLYERSLLESSLLAAREGVRHQGGSTVGSTGSTPSNPTLNQDYDPLEMDRFTGFHLLSQEMIELIVRVRESSSDIQFLVDETEQVGRNLRQITSQLQEGLNKSRMVPFAETADRMRAAVRRVSVQLKKEAELIIEGRDVLIDKMIAEHLFDPMTHLINNALTHGVETPEERQSKGKKTSGTITMGAYIQGNQTIITVSDDGAGINAEIVKRKAVEKGLITQHQAHTMSDQQAFDLIFCAGFSTKDKADDFAGRGVGMDVVRTALNEIRGTVTIDSKIGQGTTFTIRLPLMLTISKALCCLSAHHRIAFPMDGVEDMQDFFPAEIKTNAQGEQVVPWRNNLVPFKPLTDLLKYNRQIGRGNLYGGKREDDMISIVILRSGGNYFAVQVDQVLGEQEIVIKQVQGPVPKPPGIAGATVLGDGRIMAIVDVLELFDIAQGRIRHEVGGLWDSMAIEPAESEVRTEPLVLIVDDSVTVRAMLSMSFAKAGYRVEEARDGQDAWDKLRSGLPCDMVFCDIEMPRMDGLELLSKIQSDENLNHLPVAMLTSRGAEKHKQMAAQLGASAYFTKPYLEEALLEGAGRMMKGDVLMANSSRKPGKKKAKSQQQKEEQQQQFSAGIVTSIQDIPTVLIIDDSVVVRELLSSTFQNAGYQVEQARDGQDAWDKLNEGIHCDVVFCDIEMPRMNGLDLLANLQLDEKLSQIPVAMLTSRGAERHRRMAAEKGAKGYFTKPYMDEVLLDAAQRLIRGEVLIPVHS
jgi:chemotaxis protein histidine kinase CheA/DNA-binding response OmpR family regulator